MPNYRVEEQNYYGKTDEMMPIIGISKSQGISYNRVKRGLLFLY